MSTASKSVPDRVVQQLAGGETARPHGTVAVRLLALGCALGLVVAYVRVLREITRFVGGSSTLLGLVVLSLLAGTVAAVTIRERTAVALGLVTAVMAFAYYFNAAGVDLATALAALDQVLSDAYTLATGLELLRVVEARTWALAYAPVPTFLTWYLALRRHYGAATIPGGLALGFLVLTGDAGLTTTLGGALAGVGMVALGELERHDGTLDQADLLVVLLAVMVFLSLLVPLAPGGTVGDESLVPGEGSGTLEGSVASSQDRSTITGSVDLSPEVRFTIESDEPAYWRSAVYDRYLGDEWVTTGEARPYDGSLDRPPGQYETVTQRVHVETSVQATPAATQPLAVDGDIEEYIEVTDLGQIRPTVMLFEGDEYTVESAVIDPSSDELRSAGTDYPDGFDRYLQQPDDRSQEFVDYTSEVVGDADNPYDKAVAIEGYLRQTNDYSLDVDRPDGDVAEAFLLEMDEGYCVYAATTMVQMLRAEGIPARYATGYTEGQQVDEDTHVVRGLDAHAWPEVYFPDHGWVAFEPTPMSDRDAVHDDRLADARADNESNVDTNQSEDQEIPGSDDRWEEPGDDSGGADDGTDSAGGLSIPQPSTEQLAFAAVAFVGLLAGAHRFDAVWTVSRLVRLYWQRPSSSPNADAERAYERLEHFLETQYRARDAAESYRAYLQALSETNELDERVYEVAAIRERATFGAGVDRNDADAAIVAVDELVYENRPPFGRA